MRYALIGCGRIAARHVDAARACGLEIVGLCDKDIRKAVRLGADLSRLGGKAPPTYDDYRTMLARARPDLVAVATDSGSHASITLGCLEKALPVIVEKPMALSSEDAEQICRLSFEMGVPVAVCHQNRFNPAVQKLKAALDAGAIGELYYGAAAVRWNRSDAYYGQADWRGRWRTDGGVLMNQCIHAADMLINLLGRPMSVTGQVARMSRPIEAEDLGFALVTFEGGTRATFEGTALTEPANLEETLYLSGRAGTARLGGLAMNELQHLTTAEGPQADLPCEAVGDVYGGGHRALYEDMVRALDEGDSPAVTAEDGRLAMELVLAIYRSAKGGGTPVNFMGSPFATADMADYRF